MDDQIKQKINQYLIEIKQGDISKLPALFELTAAHLAMIARYYLNNKSADWDVVSEVYRRVGHSIGSFDVTRSGYAWLYKITKNAALSYNKDEERHKTVDIEKVANFIQLESFSHASDCWLDLCTAVEKLSEENRIIFRMRYLEDFSQKKIAKIFKVSESAISQRISKILQELKTLCK